MSALPPDDALDVGALSHLFDSLGFSYKHLFFDALLEAFKESVFETTTFDLKDLAVGMLAAAWYPSQVYRLSLGVRDQISIVLEGIELGREGSIPRTQLRARLADRHFNDKPLMRYVPHRLLAPFFRDHLQGTKDSLINAKTASLATEHFTTVRPLYRFTGTETIQLHPDWANYLAANYPIVTAWAERRWIGYLQARNPTVPAISEKLKAPPARRALANQTKYWKTVFADLDKPLRCIYSDLPLTLDGFALDHFLPWTFVCHDALWNLVPVSPAANALKSNRLPDISYVSMLATAHHRGLLAARRAMQGQAWTNAISPFIGDLRIPEDRLLDYAVILDAYQRSVGAQLDIARGIGFKSGWKFPL